MRRLYLFLGVAIIGLGLFHIASTARFFDELNSRALWFASGGLALLLLGALNMLNETYGRIAAGLKWTCVGANLVMLGFTALAGYVGQASVGEMITMLALLGVTTLLSARPALGGLPHAFR